MKNTFDASKVKNIEKKSIRLSKNRTKDDNNVIKANTSRKKDRNIEKGMNGEKAFYSKINVDRDSNSINAKNKGNNNKSIRHNHKYTKSNISNHSKDIYTEYSLCQKEIQLLLDKEEKLKTLKNELRLKEREDRISTISNIKNKKNNTNFKKKNLSQILINSNQASDDKRNKTSIGFYNEKQKMKHYRIITDINNSNSKSIHEKISSTYRDHLKSYSNEKNEKKKITSNKGFIYKKKDKNGLNINLFPELKKSVSNTADIHSKQNNKKSKLSFKKPKRIVTNLNKTHYPKTCKNTSSNTSRIHNSSSQNAIKNIKKFNRYTKVNKSKMNNSKSFYTSIKPNSISKAPKVIDLKPNKKNKEKSKKKTIINESEKNNDNENENKKPMVEKNEENQKKIRCIEAVGIITKAGEENEGEPKVNQDNYFDKDISNGYKFIGVCDGHGEDGQQISAYLREHLPEELNKELNKVISSENKRLSILECMLKKNREALLGKEDDDNNEKENEEQKKNDEKKEKSKLITNFEQKGKVNELFKKVFISTNIQLIEDNYMFNLENSGSTCVSVFLQKNDIKKIYVANVGDSRAIIIKKPISNNKNNDENGKNDLWSFEQLSRDHKLSEQDEAERILSYGGEIERAQNDKGEYEGPLRLYKKNEEGPGLAMSRSFGDVIGSVLGVIAEPEMTEYIIKNEDTAIIIGSDGLYEYVSNEEITNIVKKNIDKKDPNLIVNELYKVSYEQWKQKEGGIDDITIICILLN